MNITNERVWVVEVREDNEDTSVIAVCATRDGALAQLAEWCREKWADEHYDYENERASDVLLSEDNKTAVDEFFAQMSEFFRYDIDWMKLHP